MGIKSYAKSDRIHGAGSDDSIAMSRPASRSLVPAASALRGRHGPKVRTGCITCKVRKVKCDEAKPSCRQCTATGRRCDGYRVAQGNRKSPSDAAQEPSPTFPLTGIPDGTDLEREMLYMYRQHLIKILHPHTTDRYGSLVVSFSQQDPAIRDATVALVLCFQRSTVGTHIMHPERIILTHQNRAIGSLKQQVKALTTRPTSASTSEWMQLLLAVLQLIGFEILQGNVTGASLHLDHLARIIVDNDLGDIKISDRSGTIRSLCRVLQLNMRIYPGLETYEPIQRVTPSLPMPRWGFSLPFKNDQQVVLSWYELLEEFLDLMQRPTTPNASERTRNLSELTARLDKWLDVVDTHPINRTWDPEQSLVIRVNGRTLKLRLMVLQCGEAESHHDQFEPLMAEIMGLAGMLNNLHSRRQGTFWSHGNSTASVFHIALKCRDPHLRRAALAWLDNSNGWRGCWWGRATALAVARRIVAIEEAGEKIISAADVPEKMRVRRVGMKLDPDQREVHLTYWQWDAQGHLVPREEFVSWAE